MFGAAGAVTVRADLLRLRADTTVAEPPSAFAPSRVSLRARGVIASDPDTVLVSRQRIPSPDARLTVETALPPLAPGVYRIVMTAEGDARAAASTERTFVVRPEAFPLLVGVEDLVQPLAYLATPREKDLLREAGADSLRFASTRSGAGFSATAVRPRLPSAPITNASKKPTAAFRATPKAGKRTVGWST